MDFDKGKRKKGLMNKTWERCRSFGGNKAGALVKSKSWPRQFNGTQGLVAPEGCFSVYVGPDKQRFVIKTTYAHHPLFRMLLEEAELEYGHNSEGPLALPCNVDFFVKVLVEMEDCCDGEIQQYGCSAFARSSSSYCLLSPARFVSTNNKF